MIPIKKFDRLPPEQRRQEIKEAALTLFNEKGFSATTMENIVQRVSLSKGGVYRLYPSTAAILGDLMIDGMHLRNNFYLQQIQAAADREQMLSVPFLADMVCDSLLIHPEISAVYVEFLWEKRRNPDLEALYQRICATSIQETQALIRRFAPRIPDPQIPMQILTDLMNAAILAIHVLGLQNVFRENRQRIAAAAVQLLPLCSTSSPSCPVADAAIFINEKENKNA